MNSAAAPLLQAYLQRREQLVRFFALRMGSAAAAEDLVQDIYVKISERAEIGEGIHSPAAFLYRLGTNLMLDRLKQGRRAQARDHAWRDLGAVSASGEDVADVPAADDALAAKQRLATIIEALNALSPPCRRAFRLHKLEGLSHAETAQAMGLSKSSVEKYISAAMRHLMEQAP